MADARRVLGQDVKVQGTGLKHACWKQAQACNGCNAPSLPHTLISWSLPHLFPTFCTVYFTPFTYHWFHPFCPVLLLITTTLHARSLRLRAGNVDPMVLFGTEEAIRAEVTRCLHAAGPRGHILNVGHGVPQVCMRVKRLLYPRAVTAWTPPPPGVGIGWLWGYGEVGTSRKPCVARCSLSHSLGQTAMSRLSPVPS